MPGNKPGIIYNGGYMTSIGVQIKNVSKFFGDLAAVDNLSLNIKPGELFTLLGPSGCGKTTLLRTIAGFYYQNSGQILFNNKQIDLLPPHKRNTGMVFQSYAIFPFLSVFNNIAYGLKAHGVSKSERKERVMEALSLVRLSGLEQRRPNQLSGGQQQRVAVARAIVIEPQVLLMDEPLSNLDAKLRVDMRVDIRRLQKKLGITMIYVTHDQEEALAISDRIAVMSSGRIAQMGSPWEIYHKPANPHVANFIGVSNFFSCPVKSNDQNIIKIDFYGQTLETPSLIKTETESVVVSIRPEAMSIAGREDSSSGKIIFKAKIVDTTYLGAGLRLTLRTEDDVDFQIQMSHPKRIDNLVSEKIINIGFLQDDVMIFPDESSGDEIQ
ncbi:MAG: ABC transporter ATP-binding protein [Spirochaetes bacterium]|nr:MAG: ABC transporter ATP-binding protein [Spirochaetota bacterium]